jgi:hypothetical protein
MSAEAMSTFSSESDLSKALKYKKEQSFDNLLEELHIEIAGVIGYVEDAAKKALEEEMANDMFTA